MRKSLIFIFIMLGVILITPQNAYAKNCVKGQPCGNSCISWSYTCHIGTTTNPPPYTPTTPTCYAPQVLQNNACVTPTPTCYAPQVLKNNVCVTPTPTCYAPQVLENNVCVTPTPTCYAPQVLENNVCVTPIPTCYAPEVLQDNVCVTPIYNYPTPIQNDEIVNGSGIPLHSNFDQSRVNLNCVATTIGQFSGSLIYDGIQFYLADVVKSEDICTSVSAKYSHLTNLLTVLDVGADNINYRATFIINGDLLSLIDLKDNSKESNYNVYNRDDWGDWGNDDSDCFNTREEVLVAFDENKASECNFSTGSWLDPYTGNTYTSKSELDIDHIVPISYAHNHGAANWPVALKKQFYNDFSNLLPVSASANRSKGDKSPINWMPANTDYHCKYVHAFIYVVDKYHLDVSPVERNSIESKCNE